MPFVELLCNIKIRPRPCGIIQVSIRIPFGVVPSRGIRRTRGRTPFCLLCLYVRLYIFIVLKKIPRDGKPKSYQRRIRITKVYLALSSKHQVNNIALTSQRRLLACHKILFCTLPGRQNHGIFLFHAYLYMCAQTTGWACPTCFFCNLYTTTTRGKSVS